jgi:acyl carrier protein
MVQEVHEIYRAAFKLGEDYELRDDMGFDDIPGWDSLGHMMLMLQIESHLRVKLQMDEIVALNSVGAVQEFISRKKKEINEPA